MNVDCALVNKVTVAKVELKGIQLLFLPPLCVMYSLYKLL